MIQEVEIIPDPRSSGDWKVSTLAYEYAIERRHDKQEIIAYHWEGVGEGKNNVPHMHMGFATYADGAALGPKAHIPSGRVLVEDIIKFAIEELGVKPLQGKEDQWRKIIAKARDAVMKFKSW